MAINPFSIEGKTVLVTGASSGIGKAIAIACSKMGAKVILNGRNLERLNDTEQKLDNRGIHTILQCDLLYNDQVTDLVDKLPVLDGVVFCSGISKFVPFSFIKEENLADIFNANCFSPIKLLNKIIRAKKISKNSSVVFISSIAGNTNISPANSIYGASKSALTSFAKYIALELSAKKIRCNSILPGRIETSLIEHRQLTKEDMEKDIDKYPLKRYGKPEEVANAALFLLSDASSWITGTQIIVDGGRSLV